MYSTDELNKSNSGVIFDYFNLFWKLFKKYISSTNSCIFLLIVGFKWEYKIFIIRLGIKH